MVFQTICLFASSVLGTDDVLSQPVMQSENGSSPPFDVGRLWSISGAGKILALIEYHMEC